MLWELLTGGKPWHRDAAGKPYMEGQIMYMVITQAKRPDLPPSVGSPGKLRLLGIGSGQVIHRTLGEQPLVIRRPHRVKRRACRARVAFVRVDVSPPGEDDVETVGAVDAVVPGKGAGVEGWKWLGKG